MGSYRSLYSIRVEHDYFDGNICRAIRCRISPEGAELWRRRGLLFRQTAENEWTVVYDASGAGVDTACDTLLMELDIADPGFVLYTEWADFHPAAAYGLELPLKNESFDAAKVIRETAPKRSIGAGFCQIRIRMTEKLFAAAQKKMPMSCTLQFHAPAHRWEYLFFPHDGGKPEPEKLRLEETGGRLTFPAFEMADEYGLNGVRTASEEAVPMREHYAFRLRLTSATGGDSRPRRVLLKHLQPPEPGRYLSPELDRLRQVCYY